jgi:hypothetical protein
MCLHDISQSLVIFFVGAAQQALAQAKAEYEHATTAQGKGHLDIVLFI